MSASEGLQVRGLKARYGAVNVLHGLDLRVSPGEIVVLLGGNGAGKTTTLRSVSRTAGLATSGHLTFEGSSLRSLRPDQLIGHGIAHVPQGRGTFPEMSVLDNLLAGAYSRRDSSTVQQEMTRWFDVFPRLAERRDQLAGTLSGGEQQMLAVARACLGAPRLLMLDEPSLGLAPKVIENLFEVFADLNAQTGTALLVVEQNAMLALSIAHRGYVIESGHLVLEGTPDSLRSNDEVRRAYLGF